MHSLDLPIPTLIETISCKDLVEGGVMGEGREGDKRRERGWEGDWESKQD